MRQVILVLLGLGLACSDVRLEYPDEEELLAAVDNELNITGSYCTSAAGDVEYPVKIFFIIDGSGSQQFTDQNRQRVIAVEQAINTLLPLGNTYFKVAVFNASVSGTPANYEQDPDGPAGPIFTRSTSDLIAALGNLAEADSLTDYQGALSYAYVALSTDMSFTPPVELARTKYVIIFVSDGIPDPQCTIGLGNDFDPVNPTEPYLLCENVDFMNCIMKRDCGIAGGTECPAQGYDDGCGYGAAVCNDLCAPDPDYCTANEFGCLIPPIFGNLTGDGLQGGGDYNQPYQILQKVQEIMDLQDRYNVGEIRLHAGLVFDPMADPAVIAIFGDASQAAPLMQQVAEIGTGQYMEFYGGDAIDFLNINYDSIKQQRVVRGFFADNLALRMRAHGLEVDTDFDGLTDAEEQELGLDPTQRDTDRDGYSDLLEVRMAGFSFDPRDPCLPPIDDAMGDGRIRAGTCSPPDIQTDPNQPLATRKVACNYSDLFLTNGCSTAFGTCSDTPPFYFADYDRDGLHDCEERILGTLYDVPDSDHDGVPDLQEFIFGTDPRRWDNDTDFDKDGLPNGLEVEWHLNPLLPQSDQEARARYRYDRPETGKTLDGRSCFDFAVRRIQLGYTQDSGSLPPALSGVGYNEIRLYLLENMADNLSGPPLIRTACVRAQYVPPTRKVPSTGAVILSESDFNYLHNREDSAFNSDPSIMFNPVLSFDEAVTAPAHRNGCITLR